MEAPDLEQPYWITVANGRSPQRTLDYKASKSKGAPNAVPSCPAFIYFLDAVPLHADTVMQSLLLQLCWLGNSVSNTCGDAVVWMQSLFLCIEYVHSSCIWLAVWILDVAWLSPQPPVSIHFICTYSTYPSATKKVAGNVLDRDKFGPKSKELVQYSILPGVACDVFSSFRCTRILLGDSTVRAPSTWYDVTGIVDYLMKKADNTALSRGKYQKYY